MAKNDQEFHFEEVIAKEPNDRTAVNAEQEREYFMSLWGLRAG